MLRTAGLLALLAAATTTACGGSSSSPAAPTAGATRLAFVNMLGVWTGTYTSSLSATGLGPDRSGTCTATATITTQTGGDFSGTWQMTGSFSVDGAVVNCASSGAVNGTISTNGTLTDFTSISAGGDVMPAGCVLVRRSDVTGIVTVTTFSATWTDRASCTIAGRTAQEEYGRVLSLRR